MKNEKKNPMSTEFKVACEIYKHQLTGKKIWTNKLIERFKDELPKEKVVEAISTLFDWSIIKAEHGATEDGREGRLYSIDPYAKHMIKDLYDHWWS